MLNNGYLHDIVLIIMGAIFGAVVFGSIQAWDYTEPEPIYITEYREIVSDPEIIIQTEYVPVDMNEYLRNLSEDDEWCLLDMGMRESENQGVIGHCWVMYTVLCRCEAFGMTVREVWESSAFESSMCNTGKTPNEDCLKALELIREGWTPKPLWFRRDYYHKFATPLCQYGDHCFSCK